MTALTRAAALTWPQVEWAYHQVLTPHPPMTTRRTALSRVRTEATRDTGALAATGWTPGAIASLTQIVAAAQRTGSAAWVAHLDQASRDRRTGLPAAAPSCAQVAQARYTTAVTVLNAAQSCATQGLPAVNTWLWLAVQATTTDAGQRTWLRTQIRDIAAQRSVHPRGLRR